MPHRGRSARRASLLFLALTVLSMRPCAVSGQQHPANGESGLRARMAEFLQALPDERSGEPTRRFFPTVGDWSYTRTVHAPNGENRTQRWVLPAAETSRLFGSGKGVRVNPVIESLEIIYENYKAGLLLDRILHSPGAWRLVRGNRFVPPSCPASCPTYVEWRREGDSWVISAFGDEWFQDPERQHPHS